MKFRIGTRGSKLALWQAEWVKGELEAHGHECDLVTIETKGDKILDVSISKIGSKGVFTEEIEDQLLRGSIDLAVHSAKDMPSRLMEGFELIAFSEREKENDVLVSEQEINFSSKIRIGTSSTRRVAFLRHYYPHVDIVPVRGNLQTRIRKMKEGHCDALLLAYAGVHRMGYQDMIKHTLDLDEFTPAVGQGSMAIEIYKNLEAEKKAEVTRIINHDPTHTRLKAERAFLRTLEGGCSIPVFALAELNENQVKLSGGLVSLDGKEMINDVFEGPAENAEELGINLGKSILERGGSELLRKIREELDH